MKLATKTKKMTRSRISRGENQHRLVKVDFDGCCGSLIGIGWGITGPTLNTGTGAGGEG